MKIDGLSATIALDVSELRYLENKLSEYIAHNDCYAVKRPLYRNSYNFRLSTVTQESLLLQTHRRNSDDGGFRCEFNPSSLDYVVALSALNAILPDGIATLFNRGRITRIDLATDIKGKSLDELLIHLPRAQTNRVFSGRGGCETLYIGSRRSARSLIAYDRRAKIIELNSRKRMGLNVPSEPLTRIEVRLKDVGTFRDLVQEENHFQDVRIYEPGLLGPTDTTTNLFVDSCRFRGCNTAVLGMTAHEKARYLGRLAGSEAPWWNPPTTWSSFNRIVSQLALEEDHLLPI